MKKTNIIIERYTSGDWNIDIVKKETVYEAWLSHSRLDVSELMFGIPISNENGDSHVAVSYEEFLEIVEANLDDYKSNYKEYYMSYMDE